jgi:putative addiction module component (TIGR02574 family)
MHTDFMRLTMDQIVEETREWADEDVAELVGHIYRVSPAIEAAWHEEIHRRIAALESGRVQGVPLEETLARMRAIVDPAYAY